LSAFTIEIYVVYQNITDERQSFVIDNRDALHTFTGRREDTPAAFLGYKTQEIWLAFYFEIQFISLLPGWFM
jgi:hypothetical protein